MKAVKRATRPVVQNAFGVWVVAFPALVDCHRLLCPKFRQHEREVRKARAAEVNALLPSMPMVRDQFGNWESANPRERSKNVY